ncbi:MAG: hypothetical protein B6242_13520 [Anaerolineaceae bacterium 4572_78]|nr:MAG: hypothetical protein B6242_13520 [Anaerolineaceae bacterium 4572_78]
MLTIKCAACKRKLWKYDKIGKGHILRCYKERIIKVYSYEKEGNKIKCLCGKPIGIDKGKHINMISRSFTYTGTKRH